MASQAGGIVIANKVWIGPSHTRENEKQNKLQQWKIPCSKPIENVG
ncbi:MAG: hypothetical protein ACJAT2_001384 [Bacteriovoracaceae bacterium]|jgi:hypothetical protein